MSLRISSAGALLLLASCGGPSESVAPGDERNDVAAVTGTPSEAPAERIMCAVGGGDYADACTVERATSPQGQVLTIRQPDGGFRRLLVSANGAEVTAADGAMPAQVVGRSDREVEIAIGDARYRLPAR